MSIELASVADALEAAGIPKDAVFNSGNALILMLGGREITIRSGSNGQLELQFIWRQSAISLPFNKESARLAGAFLLSWGYKK